MIDAANETVERLPLGKNSNGQGLLLATLAMLGLGVVMVHSAVASVAQPGAWYSRVDYRHTAFAAMAALVLLIAWRMPYRWLNAGRRLPYPALAILLISVGCGVALFITNLGHGVGGRVRWLRFGPAQYAIGFQPSELIRLSLVVFLSAWLTREASGMTPARRAFRMLAALVLVGMCIALVVRDDLGSAVLIALAAGATLLLAGAPWLLMMALAGGAIVAFQFFVANDPHRMVRFTAMFDPWAIDNPAAYQPRQSILAIVRGGWFGSGLGNGIRKLGYLPEDSTDFIFSVFCEEWGFVGALLLTGLLVLWLWMARRAAARAPDRFGVVLAGSLGFLIGLQAVLHVAVDLVVAPPTGMGFPFVSAGGTALLMMAAACAMVVTVSSYRGLEPMPGPACQIVGTVTG